MAAQLPPDFFVRNALPDMRLRFGERGIAKKQGGSRCFAVRSAWFHHGFASLSITRRLK
jgi:hypothetical protein